jgi:hypothetical protein
MATGEIMEESDIMGVTLASEVTPESDQGKPWTTTRVVCTDVTESGEKK